MRSWEPCEDPSAQELIEAAFLQGQRSVIVAVHGLPTIVDFFAMSFQWTGRAPAPLRRCTKRTQPLLGYEWLGDDTKSWCAYDPSSCETIRLAIAGGRSSVALYFVSRGSILRYSLDLDKWTQTNKNTNFKRAIRPSPVALDSGKSTSGKKLAQENPPQTKQPEDGSFHNFAFLQLPSAVEVSSTADMYMVDPEKCVHAAKLQDSIAALSQQLRRLVVRSTHEAAENRWEEIYCSRNIHATCMICIQHNFFWTFPRTIFLLCERYCLAVSMRLSRICYNTHS